MPHRIATRLTGIGESVIRNMTRLAQAAGALNLAQGFPDFDPPAELVEAAHSALASGFHQYAITWGTANFRQALAEKQSRWMGLDIDPDRHITVTCGSTEAMMASVMTVTNPGDRVIIFSPFYENYIADIQLNGAVPLFVELHPPEFRFDPAELRAAFASGARALILCNPSNPTGRVFTRAELETIAALAQEFDAYVLTDEVYEHIVYAPHHHSYIASLPGMFERTLSCSSLSKTYSITGWRLGYILAPEEITANTRKVHDFLSIGAAHMLQEAAATALRFPPSYYTHLAAEYQRKRDILLGYLDRLGLPYTRPEGAYFVMVDVSALGFADDFAASQWLIESIGVAPVPGSVFFNTDDRRYVRFHFSKRDETLHQAGERLLRIRERV
jgi:aspartate/methionine/tyrosine aminotransferase